MPDPDTAEASRRLNEQSVESTASTYSSHAPHAGAVNR